jgi:hypothetical protein
VGTVSVEAIDAVQNGNIAVILFDSNTDAVERTVDCVRAVAEEGRSPVLSGRHSAINAVRHRVDLDMLNATVFSVEDDLRREFPQEACCRDIAKAVGDRLRRKGVQYAIPITGRGWGHSWRCRSALREYMLIPLPSRKCSISAILEKERRRNLRSLWLHQQWWKLTEFFDNITHRIRS